MNQATYEVERVEGEWQVRCKTCGHVQKGDTPQTSRCPFCAVEWTLGEPHVVEAEGTLRGLSRAR
jgi:predicted Zn-ribbon and HTH transcriptional regulator